MAQKRDKNGRFAGGSGGGTSNPKGTIAKGGNGMRGSVARGIQATQGRAKPGASVNAKPKLAAKPKASAAEKKAALVKKVSNDALAGKKISKAKREYVRAQQGAKVAAQKSMGGKGSKAARRIAKMKG